MTSPAASSFAAPEANDDRHARDPGGRARRARGRCRAGPESGDGSEHHLGAANGHTKQGATDNEYAIGARQLQLLASEAEEEPLRFNGATIEPTLDDARLGRQLAGVLAALRRGGWWTLAELATVAGGSEAGCSARLRDLRKPRFGAHTVERRRRGDPTRGLHEYRLASVRAA